MLYEKVYNQIIERAKNRILEGYGEFHHIVPRCLGGSDDKQNLVKLTYREHFVCHKLLCKMYPNDARVMRAISLMVYGSRTQKRVVRSKDFEYVKNLMAPFYGKWNAGREPWNKGLRGEEFLSKSPNHSPMPSQKGTFWANNGVETKKFKKDETLPEGWLKGRLNFKGDSNPMRNRNAKI